MQRAHKNMRSPTQLNRGYLWIFSKMNRKVIYGM
jgi:hypothetical protein